MIDGLQTSPWRAVEGGCAPVPPAGLSVDVCVIGAGIAGLMTAYELTLKGRKVAVIEARGPGLGETGHTTSHLANAIDDRYYHIERLHGREGARRAASSHTAAIDRYEAVVNAEGIRCGFRRLDGYLFLSPGHKTDLLEHEQQAAMRAGITTERLPTLETGVTDLGPCLRFPAQATIDPLRFLDGVARALAARGVTIYTARAEKIRSGQHPEVHLAGGGVVRAEHIVVATNSPINTLVKFHTKQAAYRTYVVGMRIEPGSVPDVLYWDTETPDRGYHYVRIVEPAPEIGRPYPMLIIGGEDHRTGQADDAEDRWSRLESWARGRFRVHETLCRWSGQVEETIDGLAYIGRAYRDDDRVYIATGDSGMGMTHGMIAGMLLSDLITGVTNPWAEVYDPSRKTLSAAGDFVRENVNTFAEYLEWLRPNTARQQELPGPGCGAVITRNLRPLAVYRKPDGELVVRSAVCTHLGCIVAWNTAAQSWDCPCHGSRYAADGSVLNGPTSRPLRPASLDGSGAEDGVGAESGAAGGRAG